MSNLTYKYLMEIPICNRSSFLELMWLLTPPQSYQAASLSESMVVAEKPCQETQSPDPCACTTRPTELYHQPTSHRSCPPELLELYPGTKLSLLFRPTFRGTTIAEMKKVTRFPRARSVHACAAYAFRTHICRTPGARGVRVPGPAVHACMLRSHVCLVSALRVLVHVLLRVLLRVLVRRIDTVSRSPTTVDSRKKSEIVF